MRIYKVEVGIIRVKWEIKEKWKIEETWELSQGVSKGGKATKCPLCRADRAWQTQDEEWGRLYWDYFISVLLWARAMEACEFRMHTLGSTREMKEIEKVQKTTSLCALLVWPWHSALSQSLADVLLPLTSLLSRVLFIMLSSLGSRPHLTSLLLYHHGE